MKKLRAQPDSKWATMLFQHYGTAPFTDQHNMSFFMKDISQLTPIINAAITEQGTLAIWD
jgi:hypothetical protein